MKGPFALPAFRRLTGAWTIGNLADSVLFLTLAIWAKDVTGSSSAAGLVFLALGLPVFLSPLLGSLADRLHRKPLLIGANLTAAAVALTLLFVADAGDLWIIYAAAFAYGCLGILNGAAQSGLVRDLLPDEHLDTANGVLSTVDQGLRIVTPLIGAALYTLWGGWALAIGTAGALALTGLVLLTVRVTESEPESADTRGSFWQENAAGFRHIRSVALLLRMIVATAIALGVIGVFDSALFELVEKGLEQPPEFFGVLMSAQGAGSIAGGITAAWLMRRVGAAKAVGIGLAMIGLAGLAMAAGIFPIGTAMLMAISIVALFAAGTAVPWIFVSLVTTRQRSTPARLQGRAATAMNLMLSVPQLAATGFGAALVAVLDYRWIMALAGIVVVGSACWLLFSRVTDAGATIGDAEAATTVQG